MHRDWVETIFALRSSPGGEDLVDLLVVATDVYTWKLLRRDRGLLRAPRPSNGCTSWCSP